jgi:hypothetical protein
MLAETALGRYTPLFYVSKYRIHEGVKGPFRMICAHKPEALGDEPQLNKAQKVEAQEEPPS